MKNLKIWPQSVLSKKIFILIIVIIQPFFIWSQLKIINPPAGVIDPECELHEFRFTVTANDQGYNAGPYTWSREYGGSENDPTSWLDINGTPTGQTCDIEGTAPDVTVQTTYSIKVIVKDNPPPPSPPNPEQQTDERIFTFTIYPPPVANAGTGGNECDKTFTLSATPSYGTGTWTLTSSPSGGAVTSWGSGQGSASTTVTVNNYGTYVFRWTETIGECADYDEVTVNFYEQPVADAGSGGDECDLNFGLSATPSVGTGTWTLTSSPSGGAVTSWGSGQGSASTTVTINSYGTYVFRWTETNGTCTDYDEVTVNFYEQPVADAGSGGDECDLDFDLSATPTIGTGTWSLTSSPSGGVVTSWGSGQGSASTTVTVNNYGTYVFRWTETNGSCTDYDEVTVNFYEQPVADAGLDGDICDLEFTLNANASVGEGLWTLTSGPSGGAVTSWGAGQGSATTTVTVNNYGTYIFRWTETNGTCTDNNEVSVNFNEPSNFDLILVLDYSSSMNGSAGVTASGYSKLDKLKEAVLGLMDPLLINNYFADDDRIGIVYFHSYVEYHDPLLLNITEEQVLTDLCTQVGNHTTGTYTAMGGGVQVAIDTLVQRHTGNKQNIIVVTDGEQNRNPMINETSLKIEIQSASEAYGGNSNINPHTPDVLDIDDDTNIKVYTVGINANGTNRIFLETLAGNTGAEDFLYPQDDAYVFSQFLTESFIDMLRGCSPQLIDYRYNTITSADQTEVFTVEGNINHVLLRMSGNSSDGSSLRFQVEKDGEILTDPAICQISDKPFYRIFSINLPVVIGDKTIHAEGEWKMIIDGATGVPYQACAIVDNHTLNYNSIVDCPRKYVGDPFNLLVELNLGSSPITDAQVSAIIHKPSVEIGRILSKISLKTFRSRRKDIFDYDKEYIREQIMADCTLLDNSTYAGCKYLLMQKDPRFRQLIKSRKIHIDLQNNGDGTYSYQFTETKIPGIYRVEFEIEGFRTDLGNYHRKETKTIGLNLYRFKPFRSRFFIFREVPSADLPTRIYLRPKDKYGNLLGPGYTDQIEVVLSNGRAGKVQDKLDGSYIIPLYDVEKTDAVDLTVNIMNETLYEGPYIKIRNRFFMNILKHLFTPRYIKSIVPDKEPVTK